MSKAEPPAIDAHKDVALFREAVRFTSAESGFVPRLIEKDYFCTVLLAYLSGTAGDKLVFKGGTCLTKVHSELYRLSEDLDYAISVAADTPRTERSRHAMQVKTALSKLNKAVPEFRVIETLKGANRSTQYLAVIGYNSMLSQQQETIKIELSLREPLLAPVIDGAARTMLQNPLTNRPMVLPTTVRCIEKMEARDFFDIDYAVRKGGLRPDAANFIDQVSPGGKVPSGTVTT